MRDWSGGNADLRDGTYNFAMTRVSEAHQLTSQFLSGRRKTQMGPVQMFVVCNVLYFLFLPL